MTLNELVGYLKSLPKWSRVLIVVVPAVAGLIIAGEVVQDLTGVENKG